MKRKQRLSVVFYLFLILTVAWIAFILCRSAQPAVTSAEESGRLLTWLQQFFPWLSHWMLRKAAHLTEFFLLGTLTSCTVRAAGSILPWPAMLTGLLVAVTDELIQLTQEGRSCELRDMCIDFFGALLAALLFWLLFTLYDKKKKE